MENIINEEFCRQLEFYNPGDGRLCEADTKKLIGMLALRVGKMPIDIVPAITKTLRQLPECWPEWCEIHPGIERGETDLSKVAMEIVLLELESMLDIVPDLAKQKEAER